MENNLKLCYCVSLNVNRPTWHPIICAGESKLLEFLETRKTPSFCERPSVVCEPHEWTKYCIPFGLHGDEVPVVGLGKAWSKILNAFSWCSLLGTGNTMSKMSRIAAPLTRLSTPTFSIPTADHCLTEIGHFFLEQITHTILVIFKAQQYWVVVFKYYFIPIWGNDPILRAYFSNGLVQPPTSIV